MAQSNTLSTIKVALKKTLQDTYGNTLGSKEYCYRGYMDESRTDEYYVDDQAFAGLGLMPLRDEGAIMAVDAMQQGYGSRYTQKFYALRMNVSEQALHFNQYDKVLDAAAMLADSAYQTQEYECVSLLNRAFNSSYAGGDGLELCSTAHVLPKGGTFGNELSTPLSLSELALETVYVALRKMVGENGLRRGLKAKKLIIPSDLMYRAKRILNSDKQNDTANNAINAVKGSVEIVEVPYMSSSTNWFVKTDAKPGLRLIWSRKPTFKEVSAELTEMMDFTGSQWFAYGWTDPRVLYGSAI